MSTSFSTKTSALNLSFLQPRSNGRRDSMGNRCAGCLPQVRAWKSSKISGYSVPKISQPPQGSELYGEQRASDNLPLGLSLIYLRLANPSTCFLFLSLPFNEGAPELPAYVRRLQASLPFKLSSKHWSRWQLNAQGTKYYRRKTFMPGDT
jgi:hypothetical protein